MPQLRNSHTLANHGLQLFPIYSLMALQKIEGFGKHICIDGESTDVFKNKHAQHQAKLS